MRLNELLQLYTVGWWMCTEVVYLTALFGCYTAGATWSCCRLGASSAYTIQPCSSLQCHFIWTHIHRVHVCLAITCHLHFWQNDGDLLWTTAVTWGWNIYQKKGTESWSGRRKFSHRSCWDLNPWPSDHESGTLITELSLPPAVVSARVARSWVLWS